MAPLPAPGYAYVQLVQFLMTNKEQFSATVLLMWHSSHYLS